MIARLKILFNIKAVTALVVNCSLGRKKPEMMLVEERLSKSNRHPSSFVLMTNKRVAGREEEQQKAKELPTLC